jgi:hypothetical protein
MDLKILCTLTEAELRVRRANILDSLRTETVETLSLPDGYAYKFSPGPGVLARLLHLVTLEHQCCQFLTFKIIVEAGNSAVVLEVTGPPEAKSTIADFFGNA